MTAHREKASICRSVSGVRGTKDRFTAPDVERYSRAFGTYLRQISNTNTVVVGRDTRPTSAAFGKVTTEALLMGGWDVVDLGVVPTPTVQLAIHKLGAAGGIVVTASHNPIAYNGLKFLQNFEGHGMFLRKDQTAQAFAIHDAGAFDTRRRGKCSPIGALASEFQVPGYTEEYLSRIRSPLRVDNAVILNYHIDRVVSAMGRDLDMIRAKSFRVAMDCCGGAGSPIDYILLDYLYARVDRIGEIPGEFPREIEPTPANLEGLCESLAGHHDPYDAVFVTDCDNDRCVLVAQDSDRGRYRPLEEDYTFAIAVDEVLGNASPGCTVVTNWSTSQMIKDICSKHHANLRRVPTGEVYTSSDAMYFHATLAGEGSCAGVIDPRVGMGRDVLVAIWHVLAALARKGQSLAGIIESFPKYEKSSRDHRLEGSDVNVLSTIEYLQIFYARRADLAFMSREDGLIVAFQDGSRIQIRASNTEPLLRVRSWSQELGKADALADEAVKALENCTPSAVKVSVPD